MKGKRAKVKLSELSMALDFDGLSESEALFDRSTGKIVAVESSLFAAMEDDPDFDDAGLPAWQAEELATARAILEDNEERFIKPPGREEFDEYACMADFCSGLEDAQVRDELLGLIHGRGAFGRFKDGIHRHRIEDEWYAFRDERQKEILLEWCKEHDIEFDDDLRTGPREHETTDREHLLQAAVWFVEQAGSLEEVERIALIGSLCTDQRKPRDIDLLVTITPGAAVKRIAALKRKLQSRISRGSLGADVFIAEGGTYIGRACGYREPWERVVCRQAELACDAGRPHLCDTARNFALDQASIERPPAVLWPEPVANTELPEDVLAAFPGLRGSSA